MVFMKITNRGSNLLQYPHSALIVQLRIFLQILAQRHLATWKNENPLSAWRDHRADQLDAVRVIQRFQKLHFSPKQILLRGNTF